MSFSPAILFEARWLHYQQKARRMVRPFVGLVAVSILFFSGCSGSSSPHSSQPNLSGFVMEVDSEGNDYAPIDSVRIVFEGLITATETLSDANGKWTLPPDAGTDGTVTGMKQGYTIGGFGGDFANDPYVKIYLTRPMAHAVIIDSTVGSTRPGDTGLIVYGHDPFMIGDHRWGVEVTMDPTPSIRDGQFR